MSMIETLKGKLKGPAQTPEAEARARLARAERDLEAGEKVYQAARGELAKATRLRQASRLLALQDKVDRAFGALKEPRQRRDRAAGELGALDAEARLAPPLRAARTRQRDARAAHTTAVAALEEALRKGQGDSLRALREKAAEALDAVRLADSALSNVVQVDVAERSRARQERVRALRERRRELVPQLDAAFEALVRLAAEAGDLQEQLQGLGEICPPVSLGHSWTTAALEAWRRAVAAHEMGPPPAA
jgi:hypothetical protein